MKIKQIETPVYANSAADITPIKRVLFNRGVQDPSGFFEIGWHSVGDPRTLDNIESALNLVLASLTLGDDIGILVDSDVDGFTSAAVLCNVIKAHAERQKWPNTNFKFFFHSGKQHGLSDDEVMEQILKAKLPLLIVPDASGDEGEYERLNKAGTRIVVLDHHDTDPLEHVNLGDTIVVNNQHSFKYLNKSLSGVGVVYQFCSLLDQHCGMMIAEQYLDLVALGLVADVMDLRSDETRFLIQVGCKNPRSNFILQCLDQFEYQMQGELTPFTMAFYIAPMINAVNRIGTQEEKEILFKAMIDETGSEPVASGKRGAKGEMVPLIMEALRQGANAKSRQTRRQEKLSQLIDNVIEEEGLLENKVILVTIDDFDADQRALSGLIANKLIEAYQRPVLLLFWNEEEEEYHGSARAPSDIEAFAGFREQCNKSGLFLYASGHDQAHGVGIPAENIEEVVSYFNEKYAGVYVEPTYFCDFIFSANDAELGDVIMDLTEHPEIWGTGVKEPLIAVTGVQISKSNTALFTKRTSTLKITLPTDISCVKFFSSQEEYDSIILPYSGGTEQAYTATIVARAARNTWQGKTEPQLKIVNYHIEGSNYVF